MHEERFTRWFAWKNKNTIQNIHYPGIYACALSANNLTSQDFQWLQALMYIGMTNSITGIKGRLQQFDTTIRGTRTTHDGADRLRDKYRDYQLLNSQLYVAVAPFECDVTSNSPADLRIMGEVAKFEYECFACFAEKFGTLPEFNNTRLSSKFSKTRI
jgi:hypothetical protein